MACLRPWGHAPWGGDRLAACARLQPRADRARAGRRRPRPGARAGRAPRRAGAPAGPARTRDRKDPRPARRGGTRPDTEPRRTGRTGRTRRAGERAGTRGRCPHRVRPPLAVGRRAIRVARGARTDLHRRTARQRQDAVGAAAGRRAAECRMAGPGPGRGRRRRGQGATARRHRAAVASRSGDDLADGGRRDAVGCADNAARATGGGRAASARRGHDRTGARRGHAAGADRPPAAPWTRRAPDLHAHAFIRDPRSGSGRPGRNDSPVPGQPQPADAGRAA